MEDSRFDAYAAQFGSWLDHKSGYDNSHFGPDGPGGRMGGTLVPGVAGPHRAADAHARAPAVSALAPAQRAAK